MNKKDREQLISFDDEKTNRFIRIYTRNIDYFFYEKINDVYQNGAKTLSGEIFHISEEEMEEIEKELFNE